MLKRQILVCMTFREFEGGINDRIQRLALQSIKDQTYHNYKLIVTVYREKNVQNVLSEYGFDYVIHKCRIEDDYTHSWTEVISNSFKYLQKDQHIIYWSQADTVIEPDFFQEIINKIQPGGSGTSWPTLYHDTIESYQKGILSENESLFRNNCGHDKPYNNIFHKLLLKHLSKTSFYCMDAN